MTDTHDDTADERLTNLVAIEIASCRADGGDSHHMARAALLTGAVAARLRLADATMALHDAEQSVLAAHSPSLLRSKGVSTAKARQREAIAQMEEHRT